jgi:hypothetical protein
VLKKQLFFCLILFFTLNLYAQDKLSFGVSVMHNFPLNTNGVGIRSQIPLTNRLIVVPNIKYAPAFNKIHELYAGLNLHILIISSAKKTSYQKSRIEPQKPNLYIIAGADYNHWFNYINSINLKAKKDNILPQIGIGTSFGSLTIRFFAEAKYNILWKETYAEVGVLIYPALMKLKRKNNCPVIH